MADLFGGLGSGAASGASMGAAAGPWGAAAGGILGGALGFLSQQKQNELKKQASDEQLRRMKLEQDQILGKATVAGAASGITSDSGSLRTYLTTMSGEFQRERTFAASMAQEGYDASTSAGGFQLAGDIGSTLFKFGAANNWWKTPAT